MIWSAWATFATALLLALLVVEVLRRYLRRRVHEEHMPRMRAVVRQTTRPAFMVAVLLAVKAALPGEAVHGDARSLLGHLLSVGTIGATAWLLTASSKAIVQATVLRLTPALQSRDNRRARRTRTQLLIAHRLFVVVVVMVAIAVALLTFPTVRTIGASLLAGAGIIAAILGVAGKSTLGNLVAGVQLIFTDLLRLDDVVVVNDEWGNIDEIGLTFVVIRTWDERRIVMPASWFTENPFQNWTRDSARVIGTVYARLDYRVPVAELREEVRRALEENPLWDRRIWVVQVTELHADHVEVRALMSAADAPSSWDLRCDLRERLVTWLQQQHPEAMTRSRVEVRSPQQTGEGTSGDAVPAQLGWTRG